jgi:hypothetical protein
MTTIASRLVVFALLLISSDSCADKGTHIELPYRIVVENHSESYSFPSGIYYSYVFAEPYSSNYDVDPVFRKLLGAGVRINDAWYKHYNSGCAPPGSNIVMPAIVDPVLLVRRDSPNSTIQQFDFVQTQTPDMGFLQIRNQSVHFLQLTWHCA